MSLRIDSLWAFRVIPGGEESAKKFLGERYYREYRDASGQFVKVPRPSTDERFVTEAQRIVWDMPMEGRVVTNLRECPKLAQKPPPQDSDDESESTLHLGFSRIVIDFSQFYATLKTAEVAKAQMPPEETKKLTQLFQEGSEGQLPAVKGVPI